MFNIRVSNRHRHQQPNSHKVKRKKPKRKANRNFEAALKADVMGHEFYLNPSVEESDEVARILAAKNLFEVLELNHKDDLDEKEDEVRSSYLGKVLKMNSSISNHPRMTEAFAKLAKAYDTLSDPVRRQEHVYEVFGGRPDTNEINFDNLFGNFFQVHRPRRMLRMPQPMQQGHPDPMFALMDAMMSDLGPRAHRRESDDSDDSGDGFGMMGTMIQMFADAEREELAAARRNEERVRARRIRLQNERRRRQQEQRRNEEAINQDTNPLALLDLLFNGPPARRQVTEQGGTFLGPGARIVFGNNNADAEAPVTVQATPANGLVPLLVPATPAEPQATARPLLRAATQNYEESLQILLGMGFEEEQAIRALELANGNVDHAIALMLG